MTGKNVMGTMKKRGLAFLLACAAALALMVPAFAHGHSSRHHRKTQQNHVQLCDAEDCQSTGRHVHDGVTYCGNLHDEGYCTGKCTVSTTSANIRQGSAHQDTHGYHH